MPRQTHCHKVIRARSLLLLLLISCCSNTPADSYYRWQDPSGTTHFGDTPQNNAVNPQPLKLSLQQPLYIVDKVIDGDTIRVHGAGKVRLLGINTPEIAHRDQLAEPLGDKAHQRVHLLLAGKKVYLDFDQQRRDKYQRLLAHVRLEDGTNLNELLLREGLARALFLQPNLKQLENYFQIESLAQDKKKGIWALKQFDVVTTSRAKACITHFCRLRGKVLKVVKKRSYTYIDLNGGMQLSLRNRDRDHFKHLGVEVAALTGETVVVRGKVTHRKGRPHLFLQHALQLQISKP